MSKLGTKLVSKKIKLKMDKNRGPGSALEYLYRCSQWVPM